MAARKHESFERPHRSERYEYHEVVVLADDAFAFPAFNRQVTTQQALVPRPVALLLVQFSHRFVGQTLIGPDLPMGMRIAGTDHRAAILEDQHMVDPV